jgi:hypothetical protein
MDVVEVIVWGGVVQTVQELVLLQVQGGEGMRLLLCTALLKLNRRMRLMLSRREIDFLATADATPPGAAAVTAETDAAAATAVGVWYVLERGGVEASEGETGVAWL